MHSLARCSHQEACTSQGAQACKVLFHPFCVLIRYHMGCPVPQGSGFIHFAFCTTTSRSAYFHKAAVSS